MSALIRFHFQVDPKKLSDDEFAELWNDLKFVLAFESERTSIKL